MNNAINENIGKYYINAFWQPHEYEWLLFFICHESKQSIQN